MNVLALLVNGAFFFYNSYTLYFDYGLTLKHNFLPIKGLYISKLVWLTMVNFAMLTLYHGVGAWIAFTGQNRTSSIRRTFHFLATSIIFPVSLTVVLLFWFLVFLDPAFLISKEAEPFLSIRWFNHALHTSPVVGMTLDFLAWRHPLANRQKALRAIFVFAVLYAIDIHVVYYYSGFWAYPILGQLPLIARSVFILVCVSVFYGAFTLTNMYNSLLHKI